MMMTKNSKSAANHNEAKWPKIYGEIKSYRTSFLLSLFDDEKGIFAFAHPLFWSLMPRHTKTSFGMYRGSTS
jgi:hypothetical protein